MELIPAREQQTHDQPDAVVIILHGLGASGHDFAPIIPELRLPQEYKIKFIFPHAPERPVTINGGYVMPAWFDILEMHLDRKVDTDQVIASAELVRRFVDREVERGISASRILMAGFSQGGAVAYQLALSHPQPLGGLLAMSTYFATSSMIQRHDANASIPIEIHHGTYDGVVPEALGQRAAKELTELGYQVNYRKYPMDHAVCPEQIGHISMWIQSMLSS
ncbi:MAG: carboxylesterase [Desulfobulbus propionicus]|nr:MAG: carboxylesterase [Desulfobulbus propionicus]